MISTRDYLMAKIETFLAEAEMSPSAFGLAAVGDKSFVADLTAGREARSATVRRCEAYMDKWRADRAGGGGASPSEPVQQAAE